jgi:LmbE family N-acetylglucosaminyl deacetylase
MGLRSRLGYVADRTGLTWFRRLLGAGGRSDAPFLLLPELIEKPAGTRVVVLAPHADDEVLGCGGTIYKQHLAGDRVTAVFMTDGREGHENAGGIRGDALVELREREARAASETLGIDDCVFLRNPDTALAASPETVAQVSAVLRARQPGVLFVPSPMDTHRDHRQTCVIAAKALAACSLPMEVYLYEIWAPVPANCAVVIDLERKLEALRAHRSQLDEKELYVSVATSLAHYRGITCLPGRDIPVECFLRLDCAAFVDLMANEA